MGDTYDSIYDKKQIYRAFNLVVIKKLWKMIKKDYGEAVISEPYDPNNIYKSLRMAKETLRLTIERDYSYNYVRVNRKAVEASNKTGIPVEYLRGDEIIKLPEFDYNENRIEEVYAYKTLFDDKLDKVRDNLKGKSEQEIRDLVERAKRLPKQHQIKMKSEIEQIKGYNTTLQEYYKALEKSLRSLVKIDVDEIRDKKLYRLMYFLQFSKKYDEYSVATIDDIIKVMGNIGYQKLQTVGKETLDKYLFELSRQIRLVEAVKVIEEDSKLHKDS